ncbi:MAG: Nif11-like leader peptide family natural product precursor [Chlorobium sp.]|jgi:predicted ribosomally synthesized peptide with nif11-like leader
MSIEQARLFIERMKLDATFRERVMAIEDVAERIAFIKSVGFDCNLQDINEVSFELSDEDLDTAAGGGDNECPNLNISFN